MKPDYQNWVPLRVLYGLTAVTGICLLLSFLLLFFPVFTAGLVKTVLLVFLLAASAVSGIFGLWFFYLYRSFSYHGKKRMAARIIEKIVTYVEIPEGGKGLDVGCGSGALTIACAKRNPQACILGIDTWSGPYASYSRERCEENARAEKVENALFQKGDAFRLDFPDESFDAVMSNYVYHNIPFADRQALLAETLRTLKKGGCFVIHDLMSRWRYGDMKAFAEKLRAGGFQEVHFINTAEGLFMTRREALPLGLASSALFFGRK
ncbi:MAG: class I SAM-dependent methyltransferase [Thermoguttaceae bacterium]|nr:class I SAM-dependent methyltransferase [Thermoguttaceae bacterium]